MGHTNQGDALDEVVRYEGALLHYYCVRWSYYSRGSYDRNAKRGSTVSQ